MTAWIAIALSVISLVISILNYRRSRPMVRVTASTSLIFSEQDARPYLLISATNPGGVPVHVRQVSLNAVGGGYVRFVNRSDRGPKLPFELAANGGHGTWLVDYAQLREAIYRTVRDEVVQLQGRVVVGNRVFKQRDSISITPPGVGGTVPGRRERLGRRLRSWTQPSVIFYPFHSVEDLDVENQTSCLSFLNSGSWFTRNFKLTLVVEHSDGRRERVSGVDPVTVPRISPRGRLSVRVPLADDSLGSSGDTYWWQQTVGLGTGSGYGALTRSEALDLISGQQKIKGDQVSGDSLGH